MTPIPSGECVRHVSTTYYNPISGPTTTANQSFADNDRFWNKGMTGGACEVKEYRASCISFCEGRLHLVYHIYGNGVCEVKEERLGHHVFQHIFG